MNELLALDGLEVAYARRPPVIVDLHLRLQAGQVHALVGASGCGKTTVGLAIVGCLPEGASVRAARVVVDGKAGSFDDVVARRGRGFGMVFQDSARALDPVRRLRDQVAAVVAHRDRCGRTPAWEEAGRLLLRVGLEPHLGDRHPHQLSGGERQRGQIALALATRPRLLVLDEPTSALDTVSRRAVVDLLASLAGEGLAVLLITHDLGFAGALAHVVTELDHGRGRPWVATEAPAPVPVSLPLPAAGERRPLVVEALHPLLPRVPWFAPRRAPPPPVVASFRLEPGAGLAIVGRSGCGKTTLLRGLLRQWRAEGRVRLGELAWSDLPEPALRPHRWRLQPIFQEPHGSFDPVRSVGRSVADGARAGAPAPELVCAAVGLGPELLGRRPVGVSGGELQRAALARAYCAGPDVLVCDEPTASLDAANRARVLGLLRAFRAAGRAVLVVTHDFRVAEATCDDVAVLDAGRVVEVGRVSDVFASPGSDAGRALVAAARPVRRDSRPPEST